MPISSVTPDYKAIGNAPIPLLEEFLTFDDKANWELVATGADMTLAPNGVLNGSRYLNIASGITVAAETILLSRRTFKLPAKVTFALSMSQRIINQNVFVEMVAVDASGAVETNETFASALLNDAANVAGLQFQATTAANAIAIVRGGGVSDLVSANIAFLTTVATGGGPNFIPATLFEIAADSEEVVFSARAVDTFGAAVIPIRRTQCLPDPQKLYKIRIRVRNGGVAPASTTDVRLHFLRVMETTRLTVDMARHAGRNGDAANSLPVVVNNVGGLVLAALPAGTAEIGRVGNNAQTAAGGIPTAARLVSAAATTNATLVKATVGRLYGIRCYNAAITVRYLKLYNKATAPVPGTDTPVLTFALKPSDQFDLSFDAVGFSFPLGIGFALTTGSADADTGALTAADIVGLNVLFA